jgi:hypothetical protein
MKALKFVMDILKGKWAIGYTINKLAALIPRQPQWVRKTPLLNQAVSAFQPVWYLMKVIFFVLIVSWFKPQYRDPGTKLALLLIGLLAVFTTFWIIKQVENKETALN